MEQEKIELRIKVDEISSVCLLQLKETITAITFIYFSLQDSGFDGNKPLPTDRFPLGIDDKKEKPNAEQQRNATLNWATRKAFEDFIIGLTKSLKKAYKFLSINEISKKTASKEEFEKALAKVEQEVEKLHFPDMLTRIENMVDKKLPFHEEVISINQIRKCLVHGHGIVREKDLKECGAEHLKLRTQALYSYSLGEVGKTEITFERRKDGLQVNGMQMDLQQREKSFGIDEQVVIDINDFNDVAFTCAMFADSLYKITLDLMLKNSAAQLVP